MLVQLLLYCGCAHTTSIECYSVAQFIYLKEIYQALSGERTRTYFGFHQHSASSLQVLAQRIRWSEGDQAPTNSQPAVGSAGANTSAGNTFAAATTVSDLLEYRDPKTGLTPLMASVVKGYLAVTRQVWHECHQCCIFARIQPHELANSTTQRQQ